MKLIKTCTSIDCPERKSRCCNAISTDRKVLDGIPSSGMFFCSKCHNEFWGYECTSGNDLTTPTNQEEQSMRELEDDYQFFVNHNHYKDVSCKKLVEFNCKIMKDFIRSKCSSSYQKGIEEGRAELVREIEGLKITYSTRNRTGWEHPPENDGWNDALDKVLSLITKS